MWGPEELTKRSSRLSSGSALVTEPLAVSHSRHSWFSGDTSGDDNDLDTGQCLLDAAKVQMSSFAGLNELDHSLVLFESLDGRVGVHVADVGRNTWSSNDIVERQRGDKGI